MDNQLLQHMYSSNRLVAFIILVKQSITLDWLFLTTSDYTLNFKIEFLVKKYFLIAKHAIEKFELGSSYINIQNKVVYYDSKYGLAGLQALLSRQFRWLKPLNVSKKPLIIDVGANVGMFTLLCRKVWPESRVYSIEPIKKTFEALKKNFQYDVMVKKINAAILDYNGHTKMLFDDRNSNVSQVDPKGEESVSVYTLDTFVKNQNIQSIDLLKIDVETFEAYVLQGGPESLGKTKYLLLEITFFGNKNYTISDLFSLLKGGGYNFQLIKYRDFLNKASKELYVFDALMVNTKLLPVKK